MMPATPHDELIEKDFFSFFAGEGQAFRIIGPFGLVNKMQVVQQSAVQHLHVYMYVRYDFRG